MDDAGCSATETINPFDYETKITAVEAILQLNGDAEQTVPVLIHCLRAVPPNYGFPSFRETREAVRVRARAADAVGKFGKRANAAVARLRELLDDDFVTVREAAANALRLIDDSANP